MHWFLDFAFAFVVTLASLWFLDHIRLRYRQEKRAREQRNHELMEQMAAQRRAYLDRKLPVTDKEP